MSPTVPPSTLTSASPSVCWRSTGGTLIVGMGAKPSECWRSGLAGAEELVVRELAHLGRGNLLSIRAADRALGVPADLELGEAGPERVIEQQAPDQRLADAGDE